MREAVDLTSPFDSPLKARLRKLVVRGGQRLGLRIERLADTSTFVTGDGSRTLPAVVAQAADIPGMISLRRGMQLYLMAYANPVPGDVIEIGSWQGRSTSFLAQACEDSDNGVVHVIDTFQGTPGEVHDYAVDRSAGSDLEAGFRANMERIGLTHRVRVYPISSREAIDEVAASCRRARLLFIDAEHTYDAVKAELDAYAGLVATGGMLLFDDYSPAHPGVVEAVQEHLASNPSRYVTPVQADNALFVRRTTNPA